jgi:hypothetical protein
MAAGRGQAGAAAWRFAGSAFAVKREYDFQPIAACAGCVCKSAAGFDAGAGNRRNLPGRT